MRTLELVTYADAQPEVLFDLSLDVEVHTRSTGAHEEIVGGIRTGHMALGDDVTWRACHFGIPWTMTSKTTAYDRPHHFVDEQLRGPFASWWHRHEFHLEGTGTRMVDQVRYASPLGPLGRAVDAVFLERYMRTLLECRNTPPQEAPPATRKRVHAGERRWVRMEGRRRHVLRTRPEPPQTSPGRPR